MFSFLSGTIEEKENNVVVVNCGGVGFELLTSETTIFELPEIGSNAKVYTYMAVREDAITLYGFATLEEKNTFLKLISVSGIGGKVAISILSAMPVANLIDAIITKDVRTISSIKGLGKKTAERLIVELEGKFDDMQLSMLRPFTEHVSSSAIEEAIDTLIAMGLTRQDATQTVKVVATPKDTAEDIVKKSLKQMYK